MRGTILAGLTAIALLVGALPANAAWHGYFNAEAGFSYTAPGTVKAEKTSYRSASEGQRMATIFRSVEDDVEYKVTVVNFFGRKSNDDAIIKEASAQLRGTNKILSDEDARVESSYGRKMTVDLPQNGGRSMAALYFNQGYLIELQVTVLPANGDYGSPDMGRFVDSLAFGAGRGESDATELKLIR
ncbi:MAG TPA: hypothetical protein VHT51_01605 [Micropepsaceae bacterium]|jgi:hypothetical protein|nr:hypothetical protein [Micropepsaceae bacterium]